MKRALVSSLAIASLFVASSAFAGSQDNARMALHIQDYQAKASLVCSTTPPTGAAPTQLGCDSDGPVATSLLNVDGGPIALAQHVYLVGLDVIIPNGVAGGVLGIDVDPSIGVFGWTNCGELDFPGNGWPQSGGGNVITWSAGTNCQNAADPSDPQGEGIVVFGAFYVYAYGAGTMTITKRNFVPVPDLAFADCSNAESNLPLSSVGAAGFGGAPGIDPCFTPGTAVESTTWGGIKKLD
jgi:hypothetical protein